MEDGSGVRTRTWTVRRPPLSPPAGVAPFAGVGCPCSQPLWAASPRPRKPLARGRAPEPPTFDGGCWARRVADVWRDGVLLCGWAGSVAAVVLGFHSFSFTGSYGCRSRPSGDKWLVSHAGPLLAEPLMPNRAYGSVSLRLVRLLMRQGRNRRLAR